jgi:large conductance mechanosensitive channel
MAKDKGEKKEKKKSGIIKEFKDFIARGNVLDLAVAVIIGAAFSKIITSLVNDIIMPVIGLITGNINISSLKVVLREASDNGITKIAESSFNYGNFIQTVIDFLLVAIVIFLLVKGINMMRKKKEAAPPPPPEPAEDVKLLTEIRDLLKDKK